MFNRVDPCFNCGAPLPSPFHAACTATCSYRNPRAVATMAANSSVHKIAGCHRKQLSLKTPPVAVNLIKLAPLGNAHEPLGGLDRAVQYTFH